MMKELRFVRAENGGWVVFGVVDSSLPQPIKGAYTSTDDLLAGFVALLEPAPAPEGGDIEMGSGEV